MKSALPKYLEHYACSESALAEALGHYSATLVVPAYDEEPGFESGYEAALRSAQGMPLLIIVLNAAQDRPLPPARVQQLLDWYRPAEAQSLGASPPAWLCQREGYHLLCVDRMSEGHLLPAKQGVGLARKIGCDIAARAFLLGRLVDPFLHCTDADARLSSGYFDDKLRGDSNCAAQLSAFEHVSDSGGAGASVHRATVMYEAALRYRVVSLACAGSPYAFHAIGSTISVHAEAYAKVRGFPRRTSGEDFYLLNKLAKVGAVCEQTVRLVQLQSRVSTRTDHGTGAIVSRQLSSTLGHRVTHPRSFELLAVWIGGLAQAAHTSSFSALRRHCFEHLGEDAERVWRYLDEAGELALVQNGLAAASTAAARLRRLHERFDAFRTLKFLHALRDLRYPDLLLREAVRNSRWWPAAKHPSSDSFSPEQLRHELLRLERTARVDGSLDRKSCLDSV